MIYFVLAYHKGYQIRHKIKAIYRYLPREVGELAVWFLWLVLPFWQQVQSMVHRANRKSPFLWSK